MPERGGVSEKPGTLIGGKAGGRVLYSNLSGSH